MPRLSPHKARSLFFFRFPLLFPPAGGGFFSTQSSALFVFSGSRVVPSFRLPFSPPPGAALFPGQWTAPYTRRLSGLFPFPLSTEISHHVPFFPLPLTCPPFFCFGLARGAAFFSPLPAEVLLSVRRQEAGFFFFSQRLSFPAPVFCTRWSALAERSPPRGRWSCLSSPRLIILMTFLFSFLPPWAVSSLSPVGRERRSSLYPGGGGGPALWLSVFFRDDLGALFPPPGIIFFFPPFFCSVRGLKRRPISPLYFHIFFEREIPSPPFFFLSFQNWNILFRHPPTYGWRTLFFKLF